LYAADQVAVRGCCGLDDKVMISVARAEIIWAASSEVFILSDVYAPRPAEPAQAPEARLAGMYRLGV
jgi:hypothetical protein